MSIHRDRAKMQLVADEHLQSVLEFMWGNVPPAKVIGVAEAIPQVARLLWANDLQEPYSAIKLECDPMVKGLVEKNQLQQVSTESSRD